MTLQLALSFHTHQPSEDSGITADFSAPTARLSLLGLPNGLPEEGSSEVAKRHDGVISSCIVPH